MRVIFVAGSNLNELFPRVFGIFQFYGRLSEILDILPKRWEMFLCYHQFFY